MLLEWITCSKIVGYIFLELYYFLNKIFTTKQFDTALKILQNNEFSLIIFLHFMDFDNSKLIFSQLGSYTSFPF